MHIYEKHYNFVILMMYLPEKRFQKKTFMQNLICDTYTFFLRVASSSYICTVKKNIHNIFVCIFFTIWRLNIGLYFNIGRSYITYVARYKKKKLFGEELHWNIHIFCIKTQYTWSKFISFEFGVIVLILKISLERD